MAFNPQTALLVRELQNHETSIRDIISNATRNVLHILPEGQHPRVNILEHLTTMQDLIEAIPTVDEEAASQWRNKVASLSQLTDLSFGSIHEPARRAPLWRCNVSARLNTGSSRIRSMNQTLSIGIHISHSAASRAQKETLSQQLAQEFDQIQLATDRSGMMQLLALVVRARKLSKPYVDNSLRSRLFNCAFEKLTQRDQDRFWFRFGHRQGWNNLPLFLRLQIQYPDSLQPFIRCGGDNAECSTWLLCALQQGWTFAQ